MKKIVSALFIAMAFCIGIFNQCDAYVNRQNAVVTILDKASGKTHLLAIPLGQMAQYEKLSFFVHACKQTDPFKPENAFMFVEITQGNTLVFSGWMNKNEPGENPLQNADYDVWLVRCE